MVDAWNVMRKLLLTGVYELAILFGSWRFDFKPIRKYVEICWGADEQGED